eukprot:230004_1
MTNGLYATLSVIIQVVISLSHAFNVSDQYFYSDSVTTWLTFECFTESELDSYRTKYHLNNEPMLRTNSKLSFGGEHWSHANHIANILLRELFNFNVTTYDYYQNAIEIIANNHLIINNVALYHMELWDMEFPDDMLADRSKVRLL